MAAYLFVVEGKVVKPNTETLLISPYREIWERDESTGKFRAIQELSYIEFIVSQKKSNPYSGYAPSVRSTKIIRDLFLDDDGWEPDELVDLGIEKLKEFQAKASPTYRYWESVYMAVEKMNIFFRTFNIKERNEKTGNPIYKPRDITSAVKETDDMLAKMNKLKEKVENDLFDVVINRGGREDSPFADPENNI